jgi:hypothetical protein
MNKGLKNKLLIYDARLNKNENKNKFLSREKKTVCIYNTYFSSMGGGEKHALDFAVLLQNIYEVYLVSETDFSLENLASYFNVNLSKCIKLISTKVDPFFTSKFDIFINSTYCSNLESKAKSSFYIVSFPHKNMSDNVKLSYKFLYNSDFTRTWARKYWGNHKADIIYPILGGYNEQDYTDSLKKEKIILSVGRFTSKGHCKNHHLIAEAFIHCVKQGYLNGDWKLVLIGSCDLSLKESIEYYNKLLNISRNYNINVIKNISYKKLVEFYLKSSIYIHATGLGVGLDFPEKHEHFGITIHEAMLFGCYPIVYKIGGPAAQILRTYGEVYASMEELIFFIKKLCNSEIDFNSSAKYLFDNAVKIEKDNIINFNKIFGS